MLETTWIIDPITGALTVEGLSHSSLTAMTKEWLSPSVAINCARPLDSSPMNPLPILSTTTEPCLRVHRIYHHSVVEGPGRRSVAQVSGCARFCVGCFVPETFDLNSGVKLTVREISEKLLADEGAPRDGITILGGEPFLQPFGLLALLQLLKAQAQHITLYTGFTLEELQQRDDASIGEILALTDILIDGPFVKKLTDNAGEWRGSTNQRILHHPAQYLTSTNRTA
ncbi:MAG: 4Fe-4S cluster-binding domain-containing protein [Acidobacteria bacterium]|nr:4Fe-4S cluster-binding domain-containing protein [Acidobacteriota bacterium]